MSRADVAVPVAAIAGVRDTFVLSSCSDWANAGGGCDLKLRPISRRWSGCVVFELRSPAWSVRGECLWRDLRALSTLLLTESLYKWSSSSRR